MGINRVLWIHIDQEEKCHRKWSFEIKVEYSAIFLINRMCETFYIPVITHTFLDLVIKEALNIMILIEPVRCS